MSALDIAHTHTPLTSTSINEEARSAAKYRRNSFQYTPRSIQYNAIALCLHLLSSLASVYVTLKENKSRHKTRLTEKKTKT